MQIIKSYLRWAALAPEGRVKVFQVKKTQRSGFVLMKKQGKLDQFFGLAHGYRLLDN